MRLRALSPDQLSPEQRTPYDRNDGDTAFKTICEDCVRLGPWGVFLQRPPFGKLYRDLVAAITAMKRLSPPSSRSQSSLSSRTLTLPTNSTLKPQPRRPTAWT